jgi:hypothetical protein
VARWLLLAHQLRTRPSNARVKTWRRLQQIGAVPTRNSVYVLPNTEQCREDFAWLRSEIVALGGEATVFSADALGGASDGEIVALFQRTRDADYRSFIRDAGRVLPSPRGRLAATPAGRDAFQRTLAGLRQKLADIQAIDFFHAPRRQDAAAALARLEELGNAQKRPAAGGTSAMLSAADFQKRRWVTRPRPGVDRMASAWLIQRFIDPQASFGFVDHPAETDVPFDMYVGEFSHHGSHCTFETLADRFGLVGDAVTRIGHIVHDLDMKDSRYASPEVPAVGRMVEGLRRMHEDDHVLIGHGIGMFEALARSFQETEGKSAVSPRQRNRRAR